MFAEIFRARRASVELCGDLRQGVCRPRVMMTCAALQTMSSRFERRRRIRTRRRSGCPSNVRVGRKRSASWTRQRKATAGDESTDREGEKRYCDSRVRRPGRRCVDLAGPAVRDGAHCGEWHLPPAK